MEIAETAGVEGDVSEFVEEGEQPGARPAAPVERDHGERPLGDREPFHLAHVHALGLHDQDAKGFDRADAGLERVERLRPVGLRLVEAKCVAQHRSGVFDGSGRSYGGLLPWRWERGRRHFGELEQHLSLRKRSLVLGVQPW